jgi:hypothetical protein
MKRRALSSDLYGGDLNWSHLLKVTLREQLFNAKFKILFYSRRNKFNAGNLFAGGCLWTSLLGFIPSKIGGIIFSEKRSQILPKQGLNYLMIIFWWAISLSLLAIAIK